MTMTAIMNDMRNPVIAAQEWLKDPSNTIIIDTETTGLNSIAELVEIAIIDGNGKVLMDTLVKPVTAVSDVAAGIHGITNEALECEKSWSEVKDEFEKAIEGKRFIIIYNVEYDARIIKQTYKACGLKFPQHVADKLDNTYCAMHVYADYYGEPDDYYGESDPYMGETMKWQKLTNAAKQCSLDYKNAHRALADTKMTLGVIEFMANNPK